MYIICVVLDMCRVIILIMTTLRRQIFKSRYGVLELIYIENRIVIVQDLSSLTWLSSNPTL